MNDPDTYELAPHGGVKSNDPRPNMWANPKGNWAKIELNGWNVHHTMGKNWARNANVHLWGWQFSDNHRSYVIKVSCELTCDPLGKRLLPKGFWDLK